MSLITARTFSKIRPPAVAGTFYPGDAAELEASVRQYLERAKSEIGVIDGPAPKAVIAPHAGYAYSGLTAAAAYNALAPAKDRIRRVLLLLEVLLVVGESVSSRRRASWGRLAARQQVP